MYTLCSRWLTDFPSIDEIRVCRICQERWWIRCWIQFQAPNHLCIRSVRLCFWENSIIIADQFQVANIYIFRLCLAETIFEPNKWIYKIDRRRKYMAQIYSLSYTILGPTIKTLKKKSKRTKIVSKFFVWNVIALYKTWARIQDPISKLTVLYNKKRLVRRYIL